MNDWKRVAIPINDSRIGVIKNLAVEGNIEFAPDDIVSEFCEEVDQVLVVLGHSEALVSDESCISDFGFSSYEIAKIGVKLGMTISKHDLIVDIAKRIRVRKNAMNEYNGY